MKLDADKVRKTRHLMGLTLEDAAARAGVAKATFFRTEHGLDVHPGSAAKIAAGLDAEIAQLVPEDDALPLGEGRQAWAAQVERAYALLAILRRMREEYKLPEEVLPPDLAPGPRWSATGVEEVGALLGQVAQSAAAAAIEAGRDELAVDVITTTDEVRRILGRHAEALRKAGDPFAGDPKAHVEAGGVAEEVRALERVA